MPLNRDGILFKAVPPTSCLSFIFVLFFTSCLLGGFCFSQMIISFAAKEQKSLQIENLSDFRRVGPRVALPPLCASIVTATGLEPSAGRSPPPALTPSRCIHLLLKQAKIRDGQTAPNTICLFLLFRCEIVWQMGAATQTTATKVTERAADMPS